MSDTTKKSKEERVSMSSEVVSFFKESLAEIKADLKDIKKTQVEHDKELERQKWKHGFLGLLGGALSHIGMKISGL